MIPIISNTAQPINLRTKTIHPDNIQSTESQPNEIPTTSLSSEQISRYSRQLLLEQVSVDGQIRMLNSKVLVVGTGGLGSPVLLYLSAAGIGTLGVVDYDTVDESNIQRQIIHTEASINSSKCASAANTIKQVNSNCHVIQHDIMLDSSNAMEIINLYDVIVDASDNAATRYLLNDACVLLKKPLVSGSALRLDGQLTVYNYADGPCYRCLFPVPPPAGTVTNCNDGGVLGPITGTIGSLQALEVIKIVTGQSPNYHKKLLLFDGDSGSFKVIKLRNKRDSCIVCGNTPTLTKLIDYVQFCGSGASDKARNLKVLPPTDRITVQEYSALMHTPHVLLDVRQPIQFKICALENSLHLPFKGLEHQLDIVRDRVRKVAIENGIRDEAIPIYVICRRGNDSQLAVNLMRQTVFSEHLILKDIIGGISQWGKVVDGYPVY